MFDDFIDLNSETEEVLDNNNLVLQRTFNCYCFMPHLAWVEAAHSDAQCRLVNHWYLQESLVVFGPKVDRLLRTRQSCSHTEIAWCRTTCREFALSGALL